MGVYRNDEGAEIHIEEGLGISVSPKKGRRKRDKRQVLSMAAFGFVNGGHSSDFHFEYVPDEYLPAYKLVRNDLKPVSIPNGIYDRRWWELDRTAQIKYHRIFDNYIRTQDPFEITSKSGNRYKCIVYKDSAKGVAIFNYDTLEQYTKWTSECGRKPGAIVWMFHDWAINH